LHFLQIALLGQFALVEDCLYVPANPGNIYAVEIGHFSLRNQSGLPIMADTDSDRRSIHPVDLDGEVSARNTAHAYFLLDDLEHTFYSTAIAPSFER